MNKRSLFFVSENDKNSENCNVLNMVRSNLSKRILFKNQANSEPESRFIPPPGVSFGNISLTSSSSNPYLPNAQGQVLLESQLRGLNNKQICGKEYTDGLDRKFLKPQKDILKKMKDSKTPLSQYAESVEQPRYLTSQTILPLRSQYVQVNDALVNPTKRLAFDSRNYVRDNFYEMALEVAIKEGNKQEIERLTYLISQQNKRNSVKPLPNYF